METKDLIDMLGRLVDEVAGLRRALASKDSDNLGFGASPKPVYVHIESSDLSLWHYFDEEDHKQHITQGSLTGSVVSVVVKQCDGEYVKEKLHITVKADKTYILTSSVTSVFSRGLLLALAATTDEQRSKPLTIAVERGKKQTVFCNLYDPNTGIQIDGGWDELKDQWQPKLKQVLGFYNAPAQTNSGRPSVVSSQPQPQPCPPASSPNCANVKTIEPILKKTTYNLNHARNWIRQSYNKSLEDATEQEIYNLVRAFCTGALQNQFDSRELAANSFDNVVTVRLEMGYSLTASACEWIEQNQSNRKHLKAV